MKEEKKMPQAEETELQKGKMKVGDVFYDVQVDKDGNLILPEEMRQIMDAGMAVMRNAAGKSDSDEQSKKVEDKQDNDGTDDKKVVKDGVADSFKGLPMRELIGAPLFAAAEAQEKLASIAWDYYQRIAYEDVSKDTQTRLLKFNLERPVIQDGVASTQTVQVNAPFIGLVPIPSLLVDRVDVDFQMEVTDTNKTTDTVSTDTSTNISSKWFGVNVGISGKVTTSRENTRTTDQTAKYQVHVSASQQPQTEGLSKLMDVMASCIEPIPTNSK